MANVAVSEPDRVHATSSHCLVCAAISTLGAVGVIGWILQSPALVSLVPGVPMVFDTGLCFLLFGVAFWLTRRPGAAARRTRTVLAVVPMLLCAAVIVELLLKRPLGVDFEFLHTWYDYGNTRPGGWRRTAPSVSS